MKDKRTLPYLVCVLVYFVIGSMVLTCNTVMKPIRIENGWSDSQGAMLITCLSIGFLLMSIAGNTLMNRIGRRAMLLCGSALLVFTHLLMILVPAPALYFPLLFLAGFCWGGLNCLVNTVVSEMYNGSTSRLNILNAGYATGAVLFPMLVGFLNQNGVSWRIPMLIVAVLGALIFLAGLFIRLPEKLPAPAASAMRTSGSFAFLKELSFYLCFLVLFVYVGTETAVSAWLSSYLSQYNSFFAQNVPSETMVSLMWCMLLVGRLFFAAAGARLDRRILLIGLSAGFLAGLAGIIVFAASTPLAVSFVIITGLSMSAMYATAVSNAQRYITGSPAAAGMIFGSAGLGSSILPLLAGIFSDAISLKAGMISLCFFLVLLLAAAVVNLKTAKEA